MVSHTTTGEWQSFELRMRRRRAARLALRAEVAAQAGCYEDARACLDEARALAPELPALAEVERTLERPVEVSPPASTGGRRTLQLAAAAVALVLVGAAFTLFEWPSQNSSLAPRSFVETPAAQPAGATSSSPSSVTPLQAASTPVDRPAVLTPVGQSVTTGPRSDVPFEPVSTPGALPGVVSETAAVSGAATPPTVNPPSLPVADSAPAASLAPVSTLETVLPAAPPSVPEALPATAVLNEAVAVAAPVTAAPPAVPSQDAAIRGVLARYAAAYSDLDANAAQRVWPRVNRAALARAFDGLASQQVSFESCRIDVAGEKARAQCAGRATWTPKIGAGTKTEARNWTFDLARSGAGWDIVNARAQNK